MTVCEKVSIGDESGDDTKYVQYDDVTDKTQKESTIAYLRDCGFEITTEPHPVQGPDGESCLSWGELSDFYGSRDE